MFSFKPFTNIFWILANLLEVLALLIIVEIIISWAIYFGARGISRHHPWVRTLEKITTPILSPFRALFPPERLRGFDLSPLLALILIQIVQGILINMGR